MTLPDTDDVDSLGGILQNYSPVEDPTTDLDADADNRNRANVAMMTHTAQRSWCQFRAAATAGSMVLVAHDALWGSTLAVAPALGRSSAGVFTLTYPTDVNDELGESHTLNFRAARANSRGGATLYHCHAIPTSANVITVYVFNAAGVANDAVGVDFDIFGL